MQTEQHNDLCLCGHKRSAHVQNGCLACEPCMEFRPAEPAPESEQTLKGGDEPCTTDETASASDASRFGSSEVCDPLNPTASNAAESDVQPADSGGNEDGQFVPLSKWKARVAQNADTKCNRTACENRGACHWNRFTCALYCTSCARLINEAAEVWICDWPEKEDSGDKTPEQMRVEIAKSLGWTDFMGELGRPPNLSPHHVKMPDFTASLDAMATAEATLTDEEWPDYINALVEVTIKNRWARPLISATALQRALAFLAVKGAK